jgi:hypothetical protein
MILSRINATTTVAGTARLQYSISFTAIPPQHPGRRTNAVCRARFPARPLPGPWKHAGVIL